MDLCDLFLSLVYLRHNFLDVLAIAGLHQALLFVVAAWIGWSFVEDYGGATALLWRSCKHSRHQNLERLGGSAHSWDVSWAPNYTSSIRDPGLQIH